MRFEPIYYRLSRLLIAHEATKVLDMGCGDGTLGLALKRNRAFKGEYFGIDSDQPSIDCLQSKRLKGECANFRWLDYRKNSWDVVVMKDTLEYLPNLDYLSDIVRIARRRFILCMHLNWTTGKTVIRRNLNMYANSYNKQEVLDIIQDCSFFLSAYQRTPCGHGVAVFERKFKS